MKPEVGKASAASHFVEECCARSGAIFATYTDKPFFQERPQLIQAITWPAAWTRDVRPGRAPDSVTETLLEMDKVLRSRGGRRRRDSGGSHADVFSSCNHRATGVQKPRKDSQPFGVSAKNGVKVLNP